MRKLLVATRNRAKLREYRQILADVPAKLVSLEEVGIANDVEEQGQSFASNAIAKATAYARASGLVTLADDSGLEVDALGGEPGIRSSRYAGPGADDDQRNQLLLTKLAQVPWEKRTARFRCVVAIATPGGEVRLSEGTCEGVIAFVPKGSYGFGYDPIFFVPAYGCTMAELPPAVKNRISHRALAARGSTSTIQELLGR